MQDGPTGSSVTGPAPAGGGRLRALVADDNDVNRMLIAAMLKSLGCDVELVQNGREAVDIVAREPFDVLFMDISMPQMDGMEATRLIRASGGQNTAVAIIAVTAHAMVGDRERFLAAGMNDYIAKPFRKTDLQAAVEKARKLAKR